MNNQHECGECGDNQEFIKKNPLHLCKCKKCGDSFLGGKINRCKVK